ncbi:PAS domain-containing protein [Halobacterium litoreum]|uniref:PAS domain-containing protein n=1 Tax=Halobacterium litoreum TaxID=2039234 RepID=A0ABD5NBY3_9EURY|nr:PAS domain-containing protein [Halobacterium litoreum]UHH14433.1 PAS domain-containing protein [Halobacterium litoreum]
MSDSMAVLSVAASARSRASFERSLPQFASVDVRSAADGAGALDALSAAPADCVLAEHGAGSDALAVLRLVRDANPAVPVVVFERAGADSVAADAISLDVTEYVRERDAEDALAAVARTCHDAASSYRAERDVAMLNELARNVYERMTDAFFALDRDWRFTYLNAAAEELLEVDSDEVVGENVWEAFPEAIERDFYTEYHRAMATQEPVTVHEYYPPLDKTFAVRAFPSEDGLSVHFRSVVSDTDATREDPVMELTNVLSSDLADSIDAVRADVAALDEACDCEGAPIDDVAASLDRMEDLVNHAVRLASERPMPADRDR